jgi:putative transposase
LEEEVCRTQGIHIKYIQPGKPIQNAYIERFNRSYREDVFDAYMFESLRHLRELSSEWQDEYNEFHPHQSLNNLSPNKYFILILKIGRSNLTQFEKWGTNNFFII